MILIFRAVQLQAMPNPTPVLVLCLNQELAARSTRCSGSRGGAFQ
jgi:hypothetical protein